MQPLCAPSRGRPRGLCATIRSLPPIVRLPIRGPQQQSRTLNGWPSDSLALGADIRLAPLLALATRAIEWRSESLAIRLAS